jgi:hypothetical protein
MLAAADANGLALRGWAWAVISFAGFVIALFAVLPLTSYVAGPLGMSLGAELALHAMLWVLASGGLAWLAAWLVLGQSLRITGLALAILAVGAAITALLEGTLEAWSVGRYGVFDAELIGPTVALFALVAGVGVAGFAAQLAPVAARQPARAATFGGLLFTVVILLGNVPGLGDGLAADSVPLALAMIAALAYVLAVTWLTISPPRAPAEPTPR